MKNLIMDILLGMLPEILYFTLFLIYIKKIKDKKIKLFLGITIIYIICIMIIRYRLLFYFGFLFLVYGYLKILYKDKVEIIDISVFSFSTLYLTIVSAIPYIFIRENFWNSYILARILLFTPFIFKNKFNYMYNKYRKIWNRNKNKQKGIKSISVRNISIIILAILITAISTCISIKIKGY